MQNTIEPQPQAIKLGEPSHPRPLLVLGDELVAGRSYADANLDEGDR